jgi:uncharacterized protein (DUF1015 family)
VPDVASVVAPPYDVITPARRAELAARDPRNIVAVELPVELPDDEPQDRYRRAAAALARWRSDGVLHKDPRPSWYVYEQVYRVPGGGPELTTRGYFGLVRLAPYGVDGGVLPHERTLDAPREDRYRLLRATGVNTSPVVGLFDDTDGSTAGALSAIQTGAPVVSFRDDDGVGHRLWVSPAGDTDPVGLTMAAARGPIVIADGHHRYETALRYRDERRMTRSCDEDPPFDWVLMLLQPTTEPHSILPTHRLVQGLSAEMAGSLLERAAAWFTVTPVDESAMRSAVIDAPRRGRFGLATRQDRAILDLRSDTVLPHLPPVGDAVRALDVSVLGAALEALCGIDTQAAAAGRLGYTTDAAAALAAVAGGTADAAFLVPPTSVHDVVVVAREGGIMPQKSTYFYPKALAGLVLNPHEW